MKHLTRFAMLLGAFGLLISCSNHNSNEPTNPSSSQNADFYLTLTIKQNQNTRTTSPATGTEYGTTEESNISSCILLIVDQDSHEILTTGTLASNIIGNPSNGYKASFKMIREELSNDIDNTSKSYYLFLIANPTEAITNAAIAQKDIQSVFTLENDGELWKDNNFLMTNAEYSEITIHTSDLADGLHTTQTDALQLGSVTIQRAMSRFDFNKEKTTYTVSENNKSVTVKIQELALFNQATKANLFKEGGNNPIKTTRKTDWDLFWKETRTDGSENTLLFNYVFTPDNSSSLMYPLFDKGSQIAFNKTNAFKYDPLTSITNADDPKYSTTTGDTKNDPYYIWRYAMENTIYDGIKEYDGGAGQTKGLTTGVIFKAVMSGDVFSEANGKAKKAIYAYQNTIIGDFDALESCGNNENPDDFSKKISIIYNDAVSKSSQKGNETIEESDELQKALVENGITIYKPDDKGNYYCYYVYYNRHNDNGKSSVMDPMEYATVRNNVYKLAVTKITKLGHPADPADDPAPEKPNELNETNEFWGEVSVEVLPWSVRINNIEF